MALKNDYWIPDGLFKKLRGNKMMGHTSFKKLLGKLLNWMNVPFADPCCDAMADSSPVRFNPTLNRLEVYSVALDAWIDVNTIDIVTTTTTTTTSSTTTTTTTP